MNSPREAGDGLIEHTLRKPMTCITRQALTWNPQGKRKPVTCSTRQALTWNPQGKRKPMTCITSQALTWNPQGKRKPMTCITRQALTWNPQGKRKRGLSRNTCRRDLEAETKRMGYTWGQLERLAQDRDAWRPLVGGLCSCRGLRR